MQHVCRAGSVQTLVSTELLAFRCLVKEYIAYYWHRSGCPVEWRPYDERSRCVPVRLARLMQQVTGAPGTLGRLYGASNTRRYAIIDQTASCALPAQLTANLRTRSKTSLAHRTMRARHSVPRCAAREERSHNLSPTAVPSSIDDQPTPSRHPSIFSDAQHR